MLTVDDILEAPTRFDVIDVYRAGDPCLKVIAAIRLQEIYRRKEQIARAVGADWVFEFGVRAGYSAAAFLTARPRARYLGIDKDDGSHGGVRGYVEYARKYLPELFPDAWVEIHPWDSGSDPVCRRLHAFQSSAFDLVHVDGDHSEAGCLRDLVLGAKLLKPGGYLLLDDYDLIPDVRTAADQFVDSMRGRGWQHLLVPSPHGDLLLQKPVRVNDVCLRG